MIQNVNEYNDMDYEENSVTISINNGSINQQEFNIYLPNYTMNDKTIIISTTNKVRVSRISIKENTAIRRMKFAINDLANTCDIEALNKKIDALHEQTEANNAS